MLRQFCTKNPEKLSQDGAALEELIRSFFYVSFPLQNSWQTPAQKIVKEKNKTYGKIQNLLEICNISTKVHVLIKHPDIQRENPWKCKTMK